MCRTVRPMIRFAILTLSLIGVSALGGPGSKASPEEIKEWLGQYPGSWKGEVRIEDANGKELKVIPTAAEYWWSGEKLRALTAFELEQGTTFVEAVSYIRNKLLYSEVTQNEEKVLYRGFLNKDALFWIPFDAELVSDRRMKEWFSEENGKPRLHIKGIELLRSGEKKAKVYLNAVLEKDR